MRQGLVVWLLLVVLAVCSVAETTAEEENDVNVADVDQVEENFITNDEVFVPTNEWQPVKEGQAVPAGLHMRLNLQTGEREAKLLDRGDAQDQADRSALAAAPSTHAQYMINTAANASAQATVDIFLNLVAKNASEEN